MDGEAAASLFRQHEVELLGRVVSFRVSVLENMLAKNTIETN